MTNEKARASEEVIVVIGGGETKDENSPGVMRDVSEDLPVVKDSDK